MILPVLAALSFALPGTGPGAADVQQAYDAAKLETGSRHNDDLKIREAQCSALENRRYACQIDFVRADQPRGRLYFTMVTIEKRKDAWALIAGLCRSAS